MSRSYLYTLGPKVDTIHPKWGFHSAGGSRSLRVVSAWLPEFTFHCQLSVPSRLQCSSFLVMTCCNARDSNLLPSKELHRSLQEVCMHLSPGAGSAVEHRSEEPEYKLFQGIALGDS